MTTRVIAVPLPDDPEQTRQVMRALARAADGTATDLPPGDLQKLHDYQRWLATRGRRLVVVPFAKELADLMPANQVRMRRDFRQLLIAVEAVAMLAQRNRGQSARDEVIANLADYSRARASFAPLYDIIAADGITPAVRLTVEAVPDGAEVSEADLVKRLNLAKSTVNYHVRRALKGGWLKN